MHRVWQMPEIILQNPNKLKNNAKEMRRRRREEYYVRLIAHLRGVDMKAKTRELGNTGRGFSKDRFGILNLPDQSQDL